MKKTNIIEEKIKTDNFTSIIDVLLYYNFNKEYYDYDVDLFKYSLPYITINILIPKDKVKLNKKQLEYQYQVYYTNCCIFNKNNICHINTNEPYSRLLLKEDPVFQLLLSDEYITKISDISMIIEKAISINTYNKYKLEQCLNNLKIQKKVLNNSISELLNIIQK